MQADSTKCFTIHFFPDTCCPGMYAISVQGKLPREKINRMRRLGMVAVSRDRSV